MKNEDLFYAMSFLDEDLIEEANKVDTKAVVTPVKKTSKPKAKVIPLVAPWIAAAAALLVIGGVIILFRSNASTDSVKSASTTMAATTAVDKSDSEELMEGGIAFEETTRAGTSTDNGSYSTGSLDVTTTTFPAIDDDTDTEELEEGPAAISEHALDISAESYMFTYGEDTYLLIDYAPAEQIDSIRGELIGTVTESDVEGLADQEIYEYIGEEDQVLVFYVNEYYVAMRLGE